MFKISLQRARFFFILIALYYIRDQSSTWVVLKPIYNGALVSSLSSYKSKTPMIDTISLE